MPCSLFLTFGQHLIVAHPPVIYVDSVGNLTLCEYVKHGGPYNRICDFLADSGLLHDRVRLDKSFPMGPYSTSGDENSLRYDLGPHHCDCHVNTQ